MLYHQITSIPFVPKRKSGHLVVLFSLTIENQTISSRCAYTPKPCKLSKFYISK